MLALALAILWTAVFGARAALLAAANRRSPERWFVFGAALGPLATAILRAAPPGTCGTCLAPVEGWELACATCGADVRDRPAIGGTTTAPAVAASEMAPALDELARAARATYATEALPPPATPTTETPAAAPAAGSTASSALVAPTATPRPTGSPRGPEGTAVLATMVFVEGSEPMVQGAAYTIAVRGQDLRVSGPADIRPDSIVVSRRIRELATTALGDRLIITGASRRLDDFYLVMAALPGTSAQAVARDLDDIRTAAADGRSAP